MEKFRALRRGLARLARALGNFILRLLRVALREVGKFLVALIEATLRGLGNLVVRFLSSPFGIGFMVFLAGYGVYLYHDRDTGVGLGLLGIIIAFSPLVRKRNKK